MARSRVSCGLDYHFNPDLNDSLDYASGAGFDFICTPLVNPRYKREFIDGPAKHRGGPLTRSDLILTSHDWTTLIVGKLSPWLQLDSEDEVIRRNSEMAFVQEMTFASHLSVPAILIPLTTGRCFNLSRNLLQHMHKGFNHQYWIRISMTTPAEECDDVIDGQSAIESSKEDSWNWWNTLRAMCDTPKKLGIVLELGENLPSEAVITRWLGEPVKAAIVPTSLFLTNKKGFPVLTKAHQKLVQKLYKLDAQIILSGSEKHGEKSLKHYQLYLDYLYQTQETPDNVARFAKGYEDYLQCPLQPLMDNLESQTYEVFEKDPIKYSQYQKAIYEALLDRVSEEDKDIKTIVVMVVGAGRGPLVKASITAAKKANRKIRVYAVEKNANAVVTLENMQAEIWGAQVKVISSDMRKWQSPEKADILVSELLGSFGDNELSPECLDGAQKFLKDDGVSIPTSYTSFLAPMSSSKLYCELKSNRDPHKHPEAPYEMPYVVRLHNVNILAEPQEVFTFHHPNKGPIDNNRFKSLTFKLGQTAVLHGFAGYFHTVLYKDVTLSTVPTTHSPEMISWFPIYFPVREPVFLPDSCDVTMQMWRLCTVKDVWYEWCITSPYPGPIHNPKGRSYTIGL